MNNFLESLQQMWGLCSLSWMVSLLWAVQFCSVDSRVPCFVTPWNAAHQAFLSITNSRIYSNKWSSSWVCHPPSHSLLSPSPIVYNLAQHLGLFNGSVLCIRWPKYWSFRFSISPSNEYSGLISLGWTAWISLQSKGLSRVFSNTTVQKHQFFCIRFVYSPTLTSIHDYWKNHSFR